MRAILIGASGLTGSLVLEKLLINPVFTQIKLISRRLSGIQAPRLVETIINFDDEAAFRKEVADTDVLFCCVGTTQKKVKGDKAAYRKIDFEIPVRAAKFCAEQHIGKYILLSSVGADAASKNFYLRLKGETETAILRQSIGAVYILRPSVLLGKRAEFRPGEIAGKAIMQLFSGLFFNGLSKYKAIQAKNVAAAMVKVSTKTSTGKFIYHYKEIMTLNNAN